MTAKAQSTAPLTPKFTLKKSGPELHRPIQSGAFFDVVGRRSAVFGYENRAFEAWTYPLKILDDFKLSFSLQGYPLDIKGEDVKASINVRPEATVFTYSHAAFTVREIIFAPVDEPGIVILLDVQSVLPLTITGSFRPKLRLMWPAGLMTGYVGWDETSHTYLTGEETNRFVGIIGSPLARDLSVMPYQEEPRDIPMRFVIEAPHERIKTHFIPIVIAGSTEGRDKAKATYDKLLSQTSALYEKNVDYYKRLLDETLSISTPDQQLNQAFEWAKIGTDKGVATNPMMGTGMVAGFRTSGESERPGFAWFFGRDSMWTALATTSYGDFDATRTALEFLKKFQREDGKIPHEISQSAAIIPWFKDYPYPWASADATPLFIIAHGDYLRASGNTDFLNANWESILKAYRFTSATDTDGNGLIENTNFGHGWVEGGALYPPHEEIYMQGVWVEACRNMAEMADVMNNPEVASAARNAAERTRAVLEKTYWLADRGFYAFATNRLNKNPRGADPGPNRETRQARMNELDSKQLIDEDTVLPAVPLWWRVLDGERAQSEIDHIGSGAMATDWGARIISNRSKLYDPLSYHYGSVWPLFTGWASMGAYRYGRPHVGYQALMANALLTYDGALGYVTELLSGDFNAAFGRSSHHQVWSEAMVITPVVRGLLGIEVGGGGKTLTIAPQLPVQWDRVTLQRVAAGREHYNLAIEQNTGRRVIKFARFSSNRNSDPGQVKTIIIAPSFPLDARIRSVTINGRTAKFQVAQIGDVQRAEVVIENASAVSEIIYTIDEGTEIFYEPQPLVAGANNQGLRVLRSRADSNALRLTIEGLGGRDYIFNVRSPRRPGTASGLRVIESTARDTQFSVRFDGPAGEYVRREVLIPMSGK